MGGSNDGHTLTSGTWFHCCLYRLFDLAQIVGRPTDRNLFYKADHARPPLSAALVR